MAAVQKLVTEDSFINGAYVPAGHIASFDEAQLKGDEPHVHDVGDYTPAVVEMAAINPAGPNPVSPQQIAPDTVQGPGGGYFRPGATVVGEKTNEADVRLADRDAENTGEGDYAEMLKAAQEENARLKAQIAGQANGQSAPASVSAQNNDDALVDGTVADITATLGEKTDAELDAIKAAEIDREKPRKGVLDAIKAEQEKRAA